ncbi:MAG: amidohydrolase family protein [Betaproteobacteria bacterium]|nr:amidohydrolase family protein [Betaproteobacteria bacterium]
MPRHILISGGSIIDGTGSPAKPGSVLVCDDKILAVGADADQQAAGLTRQAAGVEKIDATGLTVMPGLIDSHCHITFDEVSSNDELFFHRRPGLTAMVAAVNARKVLRAGVTGMFDADSLWEMGIDLRDAIEAGVVEGPRMATGAYSLFTSVGGTAGRLVPDEGTIGYGKVLRNNHEIVTEVRRQIKMGVDWIKLHVTGLIPRQKRRGELQVWTYDEIRLVVETANALDIPVVAHCRGPDSTYDAARAGCNLILHATFMDERALEEVVKRKVAIAPTLTFQANLLDYGDRIGADPVLQDIFRREIADSAGMYRRAYDAGVPMLCGTESGFSVTPYGAWHYRELEVFVRDLGLTPLQAIRCGTLEGARALCLEGKVGEIAAGRFADIIGIAGDPSKDVTILGDKSKLKFVLTGGRSVDLVTPDPLRKPISGWRVNAYGRILSRDLL